MKLTEYDDERSAILNPDIFVKRLPECPKIFVTCFAKNLVEYAVNTYQGRIIGEWFCANGAFPIYELTFKNEKIGLIMSLVGAPSTVAEYEDLFAMGVENILVFGTCGVLDRNISDCSVIVPNSAVRDEGTSFHYLPESDEITVNLGLIDRMKDFLISKEIKYTVGKVWTTDALYRETRSKMLRRKNDGCICVDMECSAIAAVASFRNKLVGQFFYAADNLDSDTYDVRSLSNGSRLDVKRKIIDLALEMAAEIFSN